MHLIHHPLVRGLARLGLAVCLALAIGHPAVAGEGAGAAAEQDEGRAPAQFADEAAGQRGSGVAASPSGADAELLERYERAAQIHDQKALGWHLNATVMPQWVAGANQFWFKEETLDGHRFTLVDADRRSKRPAFDHRRLAARLAASSEREVAPNQLPLFGLRLQAAPPKASFESLGKKWSYDIRRNALQEVGPLDPPGAPPPVVSPDGRKEAFRRDFNLWVRDLESMQETQLTMDGERYYEYAIEPDATGRAAMSMAAIWSPDSSKILTHQTDDRKVAEQPMVDFAPADGALRARAFGFRTSLPGDQNITRFRMTIIDLQSKKQTAALYQPLAAARMFDTPVSGNRAWWSADSSTAYFVDIERYEKRVHLIAVDAATGRARRLFSEANEAGYVELGSNVYTPAMLAPLPQSRELLWYSERSGWGHLYLYSLETGELLRPVTQGEWLVRDLLGLDEERREAFITRGEQDPSIDPYYRQVARVNLDTGELTPLSGSDADHYVVHASDFALVLASYMGVADTSRLRGLSPDRNHYVETIQRIDRPARTVLRNRDGEELMTVAEADVSQLPDWHVWPEPVRLKAADGETDISAAVFRPSGLSLDEQYPVLDYIYGGPQVSHVPEQPNALFAIRAAALAELGFVTLIIDGRGTAERSRAFHESSYGAAHAASNLEDHIAAIRQLAERHSYIDASRVGAFGFSGGGYGTANAMLRFPEFFQVGVAGAGNYDQRVFWSAWGERYQGPMEGDSYLAQASSAHAGNLQGKLLFMHGLMDYGVHPSGLFQLMQALIDENKDFDLLLLPQAGHESNGWAERRLWEYFLRHLAGQPTVPGFQLRSVFDVMAAQAKEMQMLRYGTPLETPPEE